MQLIHTLSLKDERALLINLWYDCMITLYRYLVNIVFWLTTADSWFGQSGYISGYSQLQTHVVQILVTHSRTVLRKTVCRSTLYWFALI